NSQFSGFDSSISTGTGTTIATTGTESCSITFESTTDSHNIQDTAHTFCIIFSSRRSDYLNMFNGIGRHTLEHVFRVIAHHIIRLTIYMDFKTAAAIYLDVI